MILSFIINDVVLLRIQAPYGFSTTPESTGLPDWLIGINEWLNDFQLKTFSFNKGQKSLNLFN